MLLIGALLIESLPFAGLLIGAGLSAPAAWAQDGPEGRERTPEQLLPEPPPPPRILDEERARQRAADRGVTGEQRAAEQGVTSEQRARQGGAEAPTSIAGTALAPQLAAPRPEASADLDEVLVVGTALRLPDLGSSLRAQREAERDEGRIDVTFLPLYDPEAAREGFDDPLFRNREMERVGFIDLFRIRFGKRSK
jgi:hypothetical protein